MHLINDPVLPNLICEEPVYEDLFQINDLLLPMPHPEDVDLNRRFESLSIDANTHGLRLEVERAKRQRLQATVRQLRRDLSLANADMMIMKDEIIQLREYQNSVNYQLDNGNARTSALAFRSLSRISQILAGFNLKGTPTPEHSSENDILLHELDLTIRQFGICYQASYV